MTSNSITVLALVKAKAGMEKTVEKELSALVIPTRLEQGCLNYDLHRALDDKSFFMFHENWGSMEDLERHREAPHMKAYRQKVGDLLAQPVEVVLFEKIGDS